MKKQLLSLVAGLLCLSAMSQNFTITGTVTEDVTGNPIANHAVYIMADSSVFSYSNTVYTDAAGNYSDVIPNGAQVGPNIDFYVISEICNGNYYTYTFSNMQGTVNSATADFTFCQNNTSGCDASFTYTDSANTGYIYFYPNAAGTAGYSYYWSFGDGTTSNTMDPWHYYSQPGTYTACLTVDSAGVCTQTSCLTITVTGGGNNACVASFYWYADTTNNTVTVINNSTNSMFTQYFWDFGDGTTGTGQTGTHIYAATGSYLVCLTITDGNCTATYCDTVTYVLFGSGANDRSGFTMNIILPTANGIDEVVHPISDLNVYPNPANENITLNFESTITSTVEISITDLVGKTIVKDMKQINSGSNSINYALSELTSGMYIINVRDRNSGKQQAMRFIKQ